MARSVTLVTGPPCAGKTTYVAARVQPGDIVLDQDVIGAAAMRAGLARVAAMTTGTAWVIRCAPGPTTRAALARQIGATDVVLLRPDDAELFGRAARRQYPRRHIQAVRDWIAREAADRWPSRRARQPRQATPAAPRSKHRVGRPYRRARQQMFALHGSTCHLCGHEGARTADHLVPVAVDSTQPVDPHGMRPAHGSGNPCPTCRRHCNQERGTKPLGATFKPALRW
ncbi:hypothetical protein ACH5AJ_36555 [Streptomyces rochei]|uniref:hypothetical protein n=1 Tax=Streptomyces rochei TaxID=1928 RepID=UPI0037A3A12A